MTWLATRSRWDKAWDDPTLTSSRQATALSTLLMDTTTPIYGPPGGTDILTLQTLTGLPQHLYAAGLVQSTNVCIYGGIGLGKSTYAKVVYCARSLAMGHRVAVFDRKHQQADGSFGGEYLRVAKDTRSYADQEGSEQPTAINSQVLQFDPRPGMGTVFNLLDHAITEGASSTGIGQSELLRMLLEASLQRRLSPEESVALTAAHRAAQLQAEREARQPILSDVVDALYVPDASAVPGPRSSDGIPILTERGIVDVTELTRWGLSLANELTKFVGDGEYAGFFDGESRDSRGRPIDLDSAKLIVIDTSAIPESSLVLAIVMGVTSAYLSAHWARMKGYKTLIVEEAYSGDGLGVVPGIFRDLAKRSRGVGLGVVSIFHHSTDVARNSPMWSLMREAEIVHIFRQDKADDAQELTDMYALPEGIQPILQTLPKGVHLLIRGTKLPRTIARLNRTPWEEEITDTDEAMRHQDLPEPDVVASEDQLREAAADLLTTHPEPAKG